MASAVTPSSKESMTDGQIDKLVDVFRSAVRKHRAEFGTDAVQQILGQGELGQEMLAPFRKRIEAVSNFLIRLVKVDRTRTPEQVLDHVVHEEYVNHDVVKAMPKGEGEEVEVVFFKLGRYVSDAELEQEYELRGLKPADAYSLAAVNEADEAFADEHPNGTHWQDSKGRWCYADFYGWRGEREVLVGLGDDDWHDRWWFAGLRKPAR